jgi:hypothetical protein
VGRGLAEPLIFSGSFDARLSARGRFEKIPNCAAANFLPKEETRDVSSISITPVAEVTGEFIAL